MGAHRERKGWARAVAATAVAWTIGSGLAVAAAKPAAGGIVAETYAAYRAAVAAAKSFDDLRPIMPSRFVAELGPSKPLQDASFAKLRTALAEVTNIRPTGPEHVEGNMAWAEFTASYHGHTGTGMFSIEREAGAWKVGGEAWEFGPVQLNITPQLESVTVSARTPSAPAAEEAEAEPAAAARPARPAKLAATAAPPPTRAPAPSRGPVSSVELTHRTGGVIGTTHTDVGQMDTAHDVVKVALDSDGQALRMVTTVVAPFVDARDGGEVVALYVDADNNPKTGGTETWSDKPGYEFRVQAMVCVIYSDNYGCASTFRKDVRGLYADIRVDRFDEQGWLAGLTEDLRRPIAGNVLEVKVPYKLLGLRAGQVIRVTPVENDTESKADFPTRALLPDATLVLR